MFAYWGSVARQVREELTFARHSGEMRDKKYLAELDGELGWRWRQLDSEQKARLREAASAAYEAGLLDADETDGKRWQGKQLCRRKDERDAVFADGKQFETDPLVSGY